MYVARGAEPCIFVGIFFDLNDVVLSVDWDMVPIQDALPARVINL